MELNVVVLAVAFLAGMASILTPCVLPLLPAILAASSSGQAGRSRQYGIVVGLVGSFIIAILLFSLAVQSLGLPSATLRWVSVVILTLFGLTLLVPRMQHAFEMGVSKITSRAPQADRTRNGFMGGLGIGAGLGFVWAPCAGPILGSVAIAGVTTSVTMEAVFVAIALGLGMSIPLLGVTIGGQRVGHWLRTNLGGRRVTVTMGVVILATAAYIGFGLDNKVNSWLAQATGISSTPTAGLEKRVLDGDESSNADASGDGVISITDMAGSSDQEVDRPSQAELEENGYPETHGN